MATNLTMAPGAPDAPQAPGPINHIGRLVGAFFSPKVTFTDIAQRPSWIVPVLVMTVLGIGVAFAMNQKVNWRDIASKRIEESPRAANMTAEQKEQQLAMSEKISPAITYALGAIGPVLSVVLVAAVLLLAYNVIGGANAKFGQAMGIVAHSYIPTILSTLFFILVLYLKPPGTVDIENPVATNVGAFLPDTVPKALLSIAKSIDIFSIWVMLLIAIGFFAVNPKKLKGKSLGIVISVWALYVAVKAGFAWIFS